MLDADAALRCAFDEAIGVLEATRLAMLHPLGFLILAQTPSPAGGYSRLHLWERERLRPEIPHSHSGDLRSTILGGALANTLWRPAGASGTPVAIVAVRKDARSVRRYFPMGPSAFEAEAPETHLAGQSYFIAAGAFHSSECLSDIAVTLVRRSPSLEAPAQIAITEDLSLDRRRRIAVPSALRDASIALLHAERARLRLNYPAARCGDQCKP